MQIPFQAYEGNDAYIFISYSHKDLTILSILEDLHNEDYRIWFDSGIEPGTEWPEEIARHLKKCRLFIAFISNNAVASHNVRREINFAIKEKKEMLCIYIEETKLSDGMSMQLDIIQALFKYKYIKTEHFYSALVKAIPNEIKNDNFSEQSNKNKGYLDSRYEILKQIATGGMGKIYLAKDKRLKSFCAIKENRKNETYSNSVKVESIIQEMEILRNLRHQCIPRIIDFFNNEEYIALVMEYIEGELLSDKIKDSGAQSEFKVISWAKQLCGILDYLHTRKPMIIYRDVKPNNIVEDVDGNLVLLDFGISRYYKEIVKSDTVALGTIGYAAPEQFGQSQTDVRTDIYSLGVTLYHLITGKGPDEPPYEIYPIRIYNPKFSRGLEKIIERCVKVNPDERYQSCKELLFDLENIKKLSKRSFWEVINFRKSNTKLKLPINESINNDIQVPAPMVVVNEKSDHLKYTTDIINSTTE